jgi:CRP-like cAMP-binding protein
MTNARAIGEFGSIRLLPQGAQLFGQDTHSGDVYLVKTGAVKLVWRGSDGEEVITSIRWPGSWVGAESALTGTPNTAAAMALIRSTVEQLSAKVFRDKMRSDMALAARVHDYLSREILQQLADFGSLATKPAKKRLKKFLRKAAEFQLRSHLPARWPIESAHQKERTLLDSGYRAGTSQPHFE